MNNELWSEVEEAYAKAAELPPEARIPFLKTTYANRPEIWTEVESLLQNQPAAEQLDQFCIMRAAAEMFEDGDAEPIGTVVAGKYRIRERLGSGGMAEVYLADHLALNIPVALKRPKPALRSDREYRKNFLEEARRAVILDHENVARIKDVVDTNDEMFVVMEYIAGETLRKHLAAAELGFTIDKFLPLAIQCSSALAAAHEKRIVHLDVKPENIMLTPAGQVKICDFGVARRLPTTTPTATTVLDSAPEVVAGTPAYMAPEVILRLPFDERADLFSLGVVFYEMLTGSNPFFSDDVYATIRRVTSYNPPAISRLRPDIDPKLESLVNRMLSKDPNERYASAATVVQELTALRRARQRFSDIGENILEAFKEHRWLQAAAALLIVILLATPSVWIFRQELERWLFPLPERKVVAVVPFHVVDESISQALADGLTETLTAELAQFRPSPKLQIILASEVRRSSVSSAREATKVRANLAIEGSIYRVEDAFEVALNLVDTAELKPLRSTTMTIPRFDSAVVHNQIIEAAIGLLELEFRHSPNQYGASVSRVPGAYEAYLKGIGYFATRQTSNFENAIQQFREALILDNEFTLARVGLGESYLAKYGALLKEPQLLDRAHEACAKAISLDGNLAAAHVCLGRLYNETGRYREAIEELRGAIVLNSTDGLNIRFESSISTGLQPSLEIEPSADAAYRALAKAYQASDDLEAAEATYLKAVEVRPDYWYSYVWLGEFYAVSRTLYPEAVEAFKKARDLAPDNYIPYFGLCGALILAGNHQEAIQACKTSVGIRPSRIGYTNLGVAYCSLRQYSDAANAFLSAQQLSPSDYRVAGHLARAYYWMPNKRSEGVKLFHQAISLAIEVLKVNPKNADVHIMVARYYAMVGDKAEALAHLQQAFSIHPKNPHYQAIGAVVYNQLGQNESAFNLLEQAIGAGYSLADIEAEVELDNLRSDPRFQAVIGSRQPRKGS